MKKTRPLCGIFFVLLFLSAIFSSMCFALTNDALSLHKKGWNRLLAENSLVNKYALYSNRLIFVKHPEIYLKADLEAIKRIRSNHFHFFDDDSIRAVKNMKTIKESQRYPPNAPFFSFLDRRILPPTATFLRVSNNKVKGLQSQITPLEKAVLVYYFDFAHSSDNPSILYCSDSSAYIVTGTNAVSMIDMRNRKISIINCNPLLIFNEEDSWSRLLDKQPVSKPLKDLKKNLSAKIKKLSELTPEQNVYLKHLKVLSSLSKKEKEKALLFVKKQGPIVFAGKKSKIDHDLMLQWQKTLDWYPIGLETQIGRIHTGLSHLLMQQTNIRGNSLSPIAALIAAKSNCSSNWKTKIECLMNSYNKYFSWNLLWDWGFTSFSIDESLAVGGSGVCTEQSTYIEAALNLLDINSFVLHFTGFNEDGKKQDHRIIYIPKLDMTISNDKIFQHFKEPNNFKGLVYIYHNNQWVLFSNTFTVGNQSAKNSEKLVFDFIKISRENHFADDYSCVPFAVKSDLLTCHGITKKFFGPTYYQIDLH